MGELRFDTVDRTIITLQHSRQNITLRHSKWTFMLGTILLGRIRWDSNNRTL